MFTVYLSVLIACTVAVAVLAAKRLVYIARHRRVSTARLVNEWLWTIIPLAVLSGLLWQAIKMAK